MLVWGVWDESASTRPETVASPAASSPHAGSMLNAQSGSSKPATAMNVRPMNANREPRAEEGHIL